MSANEVFRFRNVRPVQGKLDGFSALNVTPKLVEPSQSLVNQLNQNPAALLGTYSWIVTLSDQLSSARDYLNPAQVVALPGMPKDWLTQVQQTAMASMKVNLANALGSLAMTIKSSTTTDTNYGLATVSSAFCQTFELASRLLLICDMLTTLAADQTATQKTFQTAKDIQTALSFRAVAMPSTMFTVTPPVIARQPGVTDLQVINSEWNRYELGELANITNLLPYESLVTDAHHMEERVTKQSTDTTQSTTQTTDNSQTSTQALSSTATQDASLNIGVQGQVAVSAQYGPVSVSTSLGAQLQVSKSSSSQTSLTKSLETVARSVKTVSSTIVQQQSTMTKIQDSTNQKHTLQNSGANVIVGQYRWLSEVQRVQMVSYPNRFVVEFELPEPGAWLRYALQNPVEAPWDNPDPGAFAANRNDPRLDPNCDNAALADPNAPPLQPTDITPTIAAGLAARWMVQGITAPPESTVTIANSYTISPDANSGVGAGYLAFNDNSMVVPDGYVAQYWTVDVTAVGSTDPVHATNVHVAVGGYGATFSVAASNTILLFTGTPTSVNVVQKTLTTPVAITSPGSGDVPLSGSNCFPVGDINSGVIPVSLNADFLPGDTPVTLNVAVNCGMYSVQVAQPVSGQPMSAWNTITVGQPYLQWQLTSFNTIAAAYQNLLQAYNQERDERMQNQTGPLVVGPPELNATRAAAELKRMVIQNLLGRPFLGYDLLTVGLATAAQQAGVDAPLGQLSEGEPGLDPATTIPSNPVIQFFEQAFEWENIVYICYPYFWGGHERWIVNATSASADPLFDQFLNAGSARVVVPARPGFESVVNFFLYSSLIWGGKSPPAVNQPDYLSVADEIQAIQVGATDGTPIDPPWEVLLPTTLLWATTDANPPSNPNPTIGPPTGELQGVSIAAAAWATVVVGEGVTLSATVSANAVAGSSSTATPAPTGQLTFMVDGQATADGPINLVSGTASTAAITTLGAGTHTVSVNYSGDTVYTATIGTLPNLTINQGSTSVTVVGSPSPVPSGQQPAFTVTVAASLPASGTPTGQVNVTVDGTLTPDSPLTLTNGSVTTAVVAGLSRGAHNVDASYLGDANFLSSDGTVRITQR